ncbi:GNAT family N-acetyltransferase [Povalibacter sp.]|uniref:GNAT family N-acetyltransferase n=1 Tax=Povalibacter sp. TaxID=1962978 RepID=UPI002F4204A0
MNDAYRITTDRSLMDGAAIHAFLTRSYWSSGIPRSIVERAMANSLCFGLLHGSVQVGFARVITDKATFAYLADVYVLEEHRGKGLSKRLMDAVFSHQDLQGLRRFMLATRDAHGLYRQFGFSELTHPEHLMAVMRPDIYKSG